MRRRILLGLVLVGALVQALPVKEKKEEKKEEEAHKTDGEEGTEDWELNLEYGRYLKEVVQALESDPTFRKKLETAEVDDIKSGNIARELHFVDHNVRTKLDELKRRELERLRHLAVKEHEKLTGVDRNLLKVPVHIDHRNPTRFDVEDLKRLIVKTTEVLEKVDEQRRDEFKKYEMEKEYERQIELAKMDEDHRKQAEAKHDEEVQKHSKHTKLHHPGSKSQLEEVWEEQDHMKQEDFAPNTFFHLHDLDGNGFWDEMEVKALFRKELDKMYDPNAPEDDLNERFEEMERMREHVFKESDTDKDNLISYKEFLDQTKRVEFEQDKGWQGLDEQEIYSQQEYEEFERQRQEEFRHLVESGAIPPPPGYHGMQPAQPALYQGGPHPGQHIASSQGLPPPHAVPQYGVPPQPHPNAIPQGYQAVPQGYQAIPQGYQAVPQGYQAVPQGYQGVPQGYQAVPQGYQAVPQGYQAVPQAHQAAPQKVQYVPQEVANQVPAQPVQGGVAQVQPAQAHIAQGQPAQGQAAQGHPAQGQVAQGQPAQGQVPQGQPAQGQVPQGQPAQGQVAQGQPAQGQVPQSQPAQVQVGQGQPAQVQVIEGQHPQLQVPVVGHVPQHPQPLAGANGAGQPLMNH